MSSYIIVNTALLVAVFIAYVGNNWYIRGKEMADYANFVMRDVKNKMKIFNEAIELHNYGATKESIELLRQEGFTVVTDKDS